VNPGDEMTSNENGSLVTIFGVIMGVKGRIMEVGIIGIEWRKYGIFLFPP
jgi:hypothetical protein